MATGGFSTLQVPWVVSPLVHWVLKTTHNPHTLSASEGVYLTGCCRHQPDSREEKQEMTLTRIEASCAQGEPFLAPRSSNPSTGLSLLLTGQQSRAPWPGQPKQRSTAHLSSPLVSPLPSLKTIQHPVGLTFPHLLESSTSACSEELTTQASFAKLGPKV